MSPPADDGTGVRTAALLGPLLRYVDERRATIWFETDRPGRVEVPSTPATVTAPHGADTWSVHGHHYALVRIEDLGAEHAPRVPRPLDGKTSGRPPIRRSRPA